MDGKLVRSGRLSHELAAGGGGGCLRIVDVAGLAALDLAKGEYLGHLGDTSAEYSEY